MYQQIGNDKKNTMSDITQEEQLPCTALNPAYSEFTL